MARLESLDVGIAPRARRAVLAAAERASGLDEAFDAMRRWKTSGGSPDADAVLGLLEWAVEAGDDEKVSWLEEELAATGKGPTSPVSTRRCVDEGTSFSWTRRPPR